MNILGNKAITHSCMNDFETKEHELIYQKVHNGALKKFYENKILSLTDRAMPLKLLRMMCQDVPFKSDNLDSKWGRNGFVRKCMKFYQGKLKEIQRSEKVGFFGLFS